MFRRKDTAFKRCENNIMNAVVYMAACGLAALPVVVAELRSRMNEHFTEEPFMPGIEAFKNGRTTSFSCKFQSIDQFLFSIC